MASLDDQTQVRRKSTSVGSTSGLLVGVRSGHVIRELSRPLEHLTLVVGTVGVLDLLSHGLHLVGGMRNTDKIAPGDAVERVARSTDFAVDSITSSDTVRLMGRRVENANK